MLYLTVHRVKTLWRRELSETRGFGVAVKVLNCVKQNGSRIRDQNNWCSLSIRQTDRNNTDRTRETQKARLAYGGFNFLRDPEIQIEGRSTWNNSTQQVAAVWCQLENRREDV